MSAKASGADASSGAARSRDHKQGNQGRSYTAEQAAAVLRIRRCKATAFYDILDLEAVRSTCSDADIKKAYRKQSLLTHPDKNGHEHADEAFKMVSRAFGVLGDKEKREKYDRFGTDPDSRFESARAQANPFSGFGRAAGGGGGGGGGGFGRGGGVWEDEISPEEMFQRFFSGGFGGPFGGFDTGPQFVFNIGGNRGFRVHQFGGGVPRARPRAAGGNGQQREASGWDTLVSLLPILFLFLFPLLSSIFAGSGVGGGAQSPLPAMSFDEARPPHTLHRTTPKMHVDYYVDPADVAGWSDGQLRRLDRDAEIGFARALRRACDVETATQQRLIDDAQGWFFPDEDKLRVAKEFQKVNCQRMDRLGLSR
ncbi:hypothetical protein DL766_004656 [Monosporascus sp. MC13-8B]|uniref:J domain-containing protein n=1 Tax=Monosporascus cannonballus TaxID=155416 RepID=A0ABY0HE62_9PEZI|nr:hypothetical protein DL763_008470 [Monosporascus cannonballus]RYO91441.1 hypothetical protein DL762_002167 [Monosporascus cannonballus]RYP30937.1 hypothetical protein DL766_004656 [Monosporascus sp. MC13-8B]